MAHKNLSHLTEQQIKELINRYYNNEKIADLLKEFEINVAPGVLVGLFPPVTHNELFCKYCQDINLISKRESRSYNMVNPFCPICNHEDKSYCSCHNCQEIINQQRQAEEEHKRYILMQTFLSSNIDIPAAEEFTLKDALYLLSAVEHSATQDLEFIKPYLKGPSIPSLAPDEELREDIINHLTRKGFIQINPLKNSLDAFEVNTGNKLVRYYLKKVLWELLPNMNVEEKEEYLDSIRNIIKGERPSSWENDVIEMWQLITKYECIENLKYLLVEHDFPVMDKHAEKQALTTFINLFQNFSVGQVFNLSWQAVRDVKYKDSLEKNSYYRYNKDNIAIIIINRIQQIADRVIANNWQIKNSRREYRLPQTTISSIFFDLFLEIGDEYYENVMPAEYNK
nr:hypothetical protein [Rickettsia endosymbiont of Ceutorhynchus assimilis]